ncbi:MAG TPA: glycine cleavage system protein GcvH [Thiothrix sp.]|nr:glycine cleavage system protein GcvH [Thiothrix sp.]
MSNIPSELSYTATHEWVRDNEDGTITVGISDHAQELLGDLVFVELPEVDQEYGAEDGIAVVESVKAASDIYAPLDGIVTEVNENLIDQPELINSSPYEDGWIFTMRINDEDMLATLMGEGRYAEIIEDEE